MTFLRAVVDRFNVLAGAVVLVGGLVQRNEIALACGAFALTVGLWRIWGPRR